MIVMGSISGLVACGAGLFWLVTRRTVPPAPQAPVHHLPQVIQAAPVALETVPPFAPLAHPIANLGDPPVLIDPLDQSPRTTPVWRHGEGSVLPPDCTEAAALAMIESWWQAAAHGKPGEHRFQTECENVYRGAHEAVKRWPGSTGVARLRLIALHAAERLPGDARLMEEFILWADTLELVRFPAEVKREIRRLYMAGRYQLVDAYAEAAWKKWNAERDLSAVVLWHGKALDAMGRSQQAIAVWQRTGSQSDERTRHDILRCRLALARRMRWFDETIASASLLLKETNVPPPESIDVLLARAAAFHQKGKFLAALDDCREARTRTSEAIDLKRINDLEQAISAKASADVISP